MATIKRTINDRKLVTDRQLYKFYKDNGGVLSYTDFLTVRRAYFKKYQEGLWNGDRLRLPYIGYLSLKRVIPYFVDLKRGSKFVHTIRNEDGGLPIPDKGPYLDYSTVRLDLEIDTVRQDWRTFLILFEKQIFRTGALKLFRNKQVTYEVFKTKECNKPCQAKHKGLYV